MVMKVRWGWGWGEVRGGVSHGFGIRERTGFRCGDSVGMEMSLGWGWG